MDDPPRKECICPCHYPFRPYMPGGVPFKCVHCDIDPFDKWVQQTRDSDPIGVALSWLKRRFLRRN